MTLYITGQNISYEPKRQKTYPWTSALSEDLGQPAQFDLNLHWTLCIASGAEDFAYVQQRLWADLSRWAHMSEGTVYYVEVYILCM